jgi:Na+-driven multidrug efflux pump
MNNEKMTSRLLLISGLIALLVMSFLFDFIASYLEVQTIQGAGYQSLLVVLLPVFQLIVVLGGLGLFLYLYTSPTRNRLEAWIFAVVGLLLVFLEALLFFLPIPMSFYALAQLFAPGTYLFLAGSLAGVIGVMTLVMKRGETPAEVKHTERVETESA